MDHYGNTTQDPEGGLVMNNAHHRYSSKTGALWSECIDQVGLPVWVHQRHRAPVTWYPMSHRAQHLVQNDNSENMHVAGLSFRHFWSFESGCDTSSCELCSTFAEQT